jgi:hypothetical protein
MTNNYSESFLNQFANWNGLKSICLTFDIDFAPDYMIQHVVDILRENKIKATFFVTHKSELLKQLETSNDIEIGSHPNLLPNSTQGTNLKEILTDLKSNYSRIQGNRFHVLKYSYRDLVYLGENNFSYDVSTIRFNTPYLLPSFQKDLNLTLLTYCWEDGVCENAKLPMTLESLDLSKPGIKIINFHPMNIYINGPTSDSRLKFLNDCGNLLKCGFDFAQKYREKGNGAEFVLLELIKRLKEQNIEFYRVKDLANAFVQDNK